MAKLPGGKLTDRSDFVRFSHDTPARIEAWTLAAQEARRLADEFAEWLRRGSVEDVLLL